MVAGGCLMSHFPSQQLSTVWITIYRPIGPSWRADTADIMGDWGHLFCLVLDATFPDFEGLQGIHWIKEMQTKKNYVLSPSQFLCIQGYPR